MTSATLTRQLKQRAREEGCESVGVARATALTGHGAALRAWLADDRHAGMSWMTRDPERRSDPTVLLPGCTSVVALAFNYWPGEVGARTPEGLSKVALYARGRDYHKVLGKKLRRLADWLETTTGCATRAWVDTGPVLERAWAERAGLGWIGKNANLISRTSGSWLLLGEILTQAELEPDAVTPVDHCGSCTACLEVCPTDAIVAPGVVDANLCISYWTIEHRGSIPIEHRPGMGDWIFGCDLCQEICPWNKGFPRATGETLPVREELCGLDPVDILGMDEQRFRERYSGTSLMRAKWEGMRRNACVVLGNRADVAALPALTAALEDEDPVIRGHAAWAMGAIGGAAAIARLTHAAVGERSTEVQAEIAAALGHARDADGPSERC
jgi:epoxyqueuosine reductase